MDREAKLELILSIIATLIAIFIFYSLFKTVSSEIGTFEREVWGINITIGSIALCLLALIGFGIAKLILPPTSKEKIRSKMRWKRISHFSITLMSIGLILELGSVISLVFIDFFLGFEALQFNTHEMFIYIGLSLEVIGALIMLIFFTKRSDKKINKNNSISIK